MSRGRTMCPSPNTNEARTFRSGAYLETLLRGAKRMDKQLQADICSRIKQARIVAGFTQGEAADTIGVTLRAYQNYESVRVPFRSLSRIADVFAVEESWLLHGEREAEADALASIVAHLESLEAKVTESAALTKKALDLLAERQAAADPPARRRASAR
jgi:transcriptional regulator with XRE-family HTH domain